MNKDFQNKLKKHLKISLKQKKDIKLLVKYTLTKATDAKDSDFDIVRKYEKEVQDMK